MDVTKINRSCCISPSASTNIHLCTQPEASPSENMAAYMGGQKDALDAVKLDPAVLEAQITIDTKLSNGEADQKQQPKSSSQDKLFDDHPAVDFKSMVLQQEAALLSLTPQQLALLMHFTDTLRRQRNSVQKRLNNGESTAWYSSHCLKDGRGRVKCPVLRAYKCPVCAATGDRAHTIKYCPENILFDADYWSCGGSV
ncbi:hypothetical protein evm_003201 [Chilo suppressalis]|nr:hypothetical protein evm_003201 [Chilo suppressalis]